MDKLAKYYSIRLKNLIWYLPSTFKQTSHFGPRAAQTDIATQYKLLLDVIHVKTDAD
jgi:hypothetical protein